MTDVDGTLQMSSLGSDVALGSWRCWIPTRWHHSLILVWNAAAVAFAIRKPYLSSLYAQL